MEKSKRKEKNVDFLKGDVKRLYFTLLASSIGSTLVTNIYSTVDCVAIGHYAGPTGSAAIACLNPLWPIMLVLGIVSGVGGSVMMTNRRGAGNEKDANEFFTLSMIISLIAASIVSISFLLFMDPLLRFFGAEGEVLAFAREYARPIAVVSPSFTLCMTSSCFVRNDGEAVLPTVATIVGGVFNIFGDIFFVFDFGLGLGGFGAGLATALGQLISFVMIISYFFRKKCKLKLTKIKNLSNKSLTLFGIGASAGITELSFFVNTVVFNKIIMKNLGETHLAIYGVASTFLALSYCFFYAAGSAAQPIVSTNYGANNRPRVKKTLLVSLLTAVFLSILFFAFAQVFPTLIVKIYMDATEEVLLIAPKIMRICFLGLIFVGLSILSSYYLQASLKRFAASLISALRGIILPVTFALVLPALFGYEAIFWAIPISEFITAGVSVLLLTTSSRTKSALK